MLKVVVIVYSPWPDICTLYFVVLKLNLSESLMNVISHVLLHSSWVLLCSIQYEEPSIESESAGGFIDKSADAADVVLILQRLYSSLSRSTCTCILHMNTEI